MRRKTVPCFLALSIGILTEWALCCSRWMIVAAAVLIPISACRSFGSIMSEKYRLMCFVCAAFFAAGVFDMYLCGTVPKLQECRDAELSGVVRSVEKKAEDNYKIEIEHENGRTLAGYYSFLKNAQDLVGRRITARGDISYPDPARNPGCFDYRMYLKSKRIDTVMKCTGFEEEKVENRLSHFLSSWRGDFEQLLQENLNGNCRNNSEEYQIICAMLFGDKSSMDEDLYESFQRNGTAHILAVSGLHIGMIYALFSVIIGGRRKIRTNLVIAALLIAYAALAGFSPSVVRAVIMILLHMISKLAHYRYDLVSAGCVTAVIMLISNPYQLFSAGFQMSFLAVMIMGFLLPVAEKINLSAMIKKLVLPPMIIQLGMLPLTVYQFNYLSLTAVLANIPVVFLAGLIVPAGVVMFILCGLGLFGVPAAGASAAAGFFVNILAIITEMMIKINDTFFAGGFAAPDIVSPPLWSVLVFYALVFFVSSEWARIKWHRRLRRQWTVAVLAAVIIALLFGLRFGNDFVDADCVFVDVGQGACVHLRTPGGSDYLFDGGGKPAFSKKKDPAETETSDNGSSGDAYDVGKKILRPYLLKNGVRKVDIAFVTHLDADHYKGIASICNLGMVKKLGLHECLRNEEDRVVRETGMKRDDIMYFSTGDRLKQRGFELDIIGPVGTAGESTGTAGSSANASGNGESTSENENSMVAKAIFRKDPLFGKNSEVSVLITGDIDEKAEAELVAAYGTMDCDIVAVPHHGSRYSSSESFISAVSPSAAVIQVGKNNMYGHPAPEVIKRYEDAGVQVFRNDTQGAVGILGKRIRLMLDHKVR